MPFLRQGSASRGRVCLGAAGALLFALVGGIVYLVLWSIGIIAALSGIIAVICAIRGYEIFAGERSPRGIAVAVTAAAVVLIFAWYHGFCGDLRDYGQALYEMGEIDAVPSMGDCLRYGFVDLPANPGYFVDLLISLAMGGVGCWGYVTYTLRREEEARQRQAEQNRTMELARAQTEQAARYAKPSNTTPSESPSKDES